jgi:Low affinity iron permease
MACLRTIFPPFGHLATDHQYRHHHRHFPGGVSDPEHPNRDARAIHLKLDEIIKSMDKAQNEMIHIEHPSDDELQKIADKYQKVREECETRTRRRSKKRVSS